MNDLAIVAAVARLPLDFKARTMSAVELIRRSGLLENPQALSAAAVRAFLVKNPDLLRAWSSGWYFSQEGPRYVVGFFPGQERTSFDDAFDACSAFILHEARELLGRAR